MGNPEPDTSVIARILAAGYNRHVRDHGPDGDYASEAIESRDGHGVVVHRGGSEFSVLVERLPAMTTTAPLSPGQCWAALREEIQQERTHHDLAAAEFAERGRVMEEARRYARVNALDSVLAAMDRMEQS